MATKFNSLLDANLAVTPSLTKPTKPGKVPRPVYIVSGDTSGCEQIFRDIGGKLFRGAWSFWEDPSAKLLSELNARGRMSFVEQIEAKNVRREARMGRYTGYAASARERSDERAGRAVAISRMIPPGQPILIGHHSEKRHRRDIGRMDTNMRKAVEESKKATYFENRVVSIEHALDRQQSLTYIGNRLREAERRLRQLDRNKNCYTDYESCRKVEQEKADHWKAELERIKTERRDLGVKVPEPGLVKRGFSVLYRGTWYPVVRASAKSVTIGNWFGINRGTFRLPYSKLSEFRESTANPNNAIEKEAV
ncbi:MAG: DUF3560 domain-containing protein [Bdellovibrionales bacterium]|nr:DUF3560 domain-containing protein [Bdellovibrionales bacterium]